LCSILQSMQRPFMPGALRMFSEAMGLALTLWLLLRGYGLYGIAWGLALRALIEGSGNIIFFSWVCLGELGLRLRWTMQEIRGLWKQSVHQFVANLAGRMKFSFDPFIVLLLLGKEAAGIYTLSTRAHDTVRMVAERVGFSIQPSLAHLHGEGNKHRFKEIIKMAMSTQATLVGVGMGGVIAFNSQFVKLWVGSENYAGQLLTILAAVYILTYLVWSISYAAIYAMGEFSFLSGNQWLDSGIRVPLMTGLVYTGGIWGAPAGSLIAQAFATAWMFDRLFLRRLEMSVAEVKRLVISLVRLISVPTVIGLLVTWAAGSADSWAGFVMRCILFAMLTVPVCAWLEPALVKFVWRRGRI
jgi:O-antigen/teichoic acid export membrane protein